MSSRDRQTQIVQDLIIRSPHLGLQIEGIEQVGDETPDHHVFTLSCSCREFIEVEFEQGKEGMWVMTALNTIRSHAQAKHPESLTAGV
jgi:hypothetical protein